MKEHYKESCSMLKKVKTQNCKNKYTHLKLKRKELEEVIKDSLN